MELVQNLDYFFVDEVEYEEKVSKKFLKEENLEILRRLHDYLLNHDDFTVERLEEGLRQLSIELEIGLVSWRSL